MTSVKDLFKMPDWALVEAWRDAKIEDIEARIADGDISKGAKAQAHRKLNARVIRLVISLRATEQRG